MYTHTYGLEKVKRSIHQLELHSQLAERRENREMEKLWASAQLWSAVGFYGVVKTFRDTPVCGRLRAFRAVIHPLKENYEKYYKRVGTATRSGRWETRPREEGRKRRRRRKKSGERRNDPPPVKSNCSFVLLYGQLSDNDSRGAG